jgi:putative ABC transport system permease protein
MHDWAVELRSRLVTLRLSPAREAEIIEELSQHLDDRVRELRGSGLDAVSARRVALDELCEPDALARWMHGLRQSHVVETAPSAAWGSTAADAWRDLVYACRMLRKTPTFAVAAILTLALGIGANTAVFSLVNATLLQRLPVAHRERLANVYRGVASTSLSYPTFVALRDGNRTLDGLAAWSALTVSLHADGTTDVVRGAIVSGNFFELLGINPAIGRLLMASDDRHPRAHPVVAISHSLWRTRCAARPDVVGREVTIAGHPFTIVGVVPAAFQGPRLGMQPELYVPMMMQPIVRPPSGGYSGEQDPDLLTKPSGWLSAIARVRPGMTLDQARDDLNAVVAAATSVQAGSRPDPAAARLDLLPVDAGDPRDQRQLASTAWLLGGVVGAVLLIACANLANLLLTRNASRQREIAIRLAIGASRRRLVRQLLTESIVIAVIGGAAGVALAAGAIALLQATPPPPGALPVAVDVAIDRRVLLFAMLLSIATGVVFGVAPASSGSRVGLVTALKPDGSRRSGAAGVRLRSVLVVAQVAACRCCCSWSPGCSCGASSPPRRSTCASIATS